ncbi:MAG: TIGR03619 family F420-dependent LLM class oxidoreductase [Chloroflexi bacterium]|nr:TIGR03619 family F420-dependent LLM class oxidoreductase [Chloroflexota bacterium]
MPDQPARPLRLSVTAEGTMYPPSAQDRLLEVAQAADQAGVDYIDTSEHVLMGRGALLAGQGWEPPHLDMPQPESLVTLAAMAGATQRIKLVSSITIAPLRPAGLLAKMVATLHAISRGRFVLGVTASWQKDEYDALGVSFERRGEILDDTIGACRVLWREAPASFHSATVNFDRMYCSPRPGPEARIPVWFGGKFTPRQIRRVVTLGDGWIPYAGLRMTLAETAEAIATLRQAFVAAGRDPTSLDVCDGLPTVQGSLERSMEQIPAMAEAGINVVRVHLRRFSTSPEEVLPTLEAVVRQFEPYRAPRA